MTTVTEPDDEIIGVTMYLERRLAPAFQRWAAEAIATLSAGDPVGPRGTAGGDISSDEFTVLDATMAISLYPDAWKDPAFWSDADGARAQWILQANTERTRRVILGMIAAPEGITGAELAAKAGYSSPRGLPAALKHIAVSCRRVGRRPMWEFHREDDGTGVYTMLPATLAAFEPQQDV